MHVVKTRGLGGWSVFSANDGSGSCAVVNATDLGFTSSNSIAATFQTINKSHPGYDPVCDCYCWGYKPPGVAIMGLGALGPGWKVCNAQGYSSSERCPCTPADCPECPPCVPGAPCPPCPPSVPCPVAPPVVMAPAPEPEEFGVNIGLLVAVVMAGGVGWYGYKKGWFKRKR